MIVRVLVSGPGMMRQARRVARMAFLIALCASGLAFSAAFAQAASPDDTARLLAGMPVPEGSPLAALAQDPIARQHAAYFDTAFGNLEKNQLSKIRAWSAATLTEPQPILFYIFGGPDFLYADAFFPKATTYVLSGLEPVGQVPDLAAMPRWAAMQGLKNIEGSLRSVLSVSYFVTVDMFRDLNNGPINGTLPILYVFLARSGKTVHSAELVHLDDQGALQPGDAAQPFNPGRGVKIEFSEKDGPRKTLYYFSGNIADDRPKNNLLLAFCRSLGKGDSFLKSASFLLHMQRFSQARALILENSTAILQDDSGVPLAYFDPERWKLRAFGRYLMPIFPAYYQPKLAEFYQRTQPDPIDFGVGYRWRPNESNLLLATRIPGSPDITASIPAPAPPQRAPEVARQQPPIYRAPPRAENDFQGPPPFFPFFLFQPPQ
jgi:hypothetical protein